MIDMIERQVNASDYTAMDIAAAFLKQALGQVNLDNGSDADYDFDNTGAEEGMVRLFINIGKKRPRQAGRHSRCDRRGVRHARQAGRRDRHVRQVYLRGGAERVRQRSPRGNEEHQDQRALCQYGTGKSKVDLINGTLSESGTVAISIDLFGVISNIIRIPENKKFQNKQTAGNSLKQNSRISSMPWLASHSVSWPRLDTHGVCPTSRRQ